MQRKQRNQAAAAGLVAALPGGCQAYPENFLLAGFHTANLSNQPSKTTATLRHLVKRETWNPKLLVLTTSAQPQSPKNLAPN